MREIEDEVPLEYRASGTVGSDSEPWQPSLGGIIVRVVAYIVGLSWPFLGTFVEYKTLNDSGRNSNACSFSGCTPLGTEFALRVLPWLPPLSVLSGLAVLGISKAVRATHERGHLEYEGET